MAVLWCSAVPATHDTKPVTLRYAVGVWALGWAAVAFAGMVAIALRPQPSPWDEPAPAPTGLGILVQLFGVCGVAFSAHRSAATRPRLSAVCWSGSFIA